MADFKESWNCSIRAYLSFKADTAAWMSVSEDLSAQGAAQVLSMDKADWDDDTDMPLPPFMLKLPTASGA
jgi:hypothetical protein